MVPYNNGLENGSSQNSHNSRAVRTDAQEVSASRRGAVQVLPPAVEAVIQFGFSSSLVLATYRQLQASQGTVSAATLMRAMDDAVRHQHSSLGASPGEISEDGDEPPPPTLPASNQSSVGQQASPEGSTQPPGMNAVMAPFLPISSGMEDPAEVATAGSQMGDEENASTPVEDSASRRKGQLKHLQALRAENRRLKARRTCLHCGEKPVNLTLLPCGHLCLCEDCGPSFNTCPLCRQTVLADVKTFLS